MSAKHWYVVDFTGTIVVEAWDRDAAIEIVEALFNEKEFNPKDIDFNILDAWEDAWGE